MSSTDLRLSEEGTNRSGSTNRSPGRAGTSASLPTMDIALDHSLRHASTFHSNSLSASSHAAVQGIHHNRRASALDSTMNLKTCTSIVISPDILGEHVLEEGGTDDDDDDDSGHQSNVAHVGQLQRNAFGSNRGMGGRGGGTGLLGNHRPFSNHSSADPEFATPESHQRGLRNQASGNGASGSTHTYPTHIKGFRSSSSLCEFAESVMSGATPPALYPAGSASIDYRLNSTLTSQGNALAQHWTRCESPDASHMGSVSSVGFNTVTSASPNHSRRQSLQPGRHATFHVPDTQSHRSPASPALSTSKLVDQHSPQSPYAGRHNSIRPASITQVTSTCSDASDSGSSSVSADDHRIKTSPFGGEHTMLKGGRMGALLFSSHDDRSPATTTTATATPTNANANSHSCGPLASKLTPAAKLGACDALTGSALAGTAESEEDGDDDDRILDEMLEEVERARGTKKCNFADFRLRHFPMNVLPPDYTAILTELTLAENRFHELPEEAFAGMVGVVRLDLSNNKLSTIPVSILTMPALETLLCDHNHIKSVPIDAAVKTGKRVLPRVITIGLEWNDLEAFPVRLIQECERLEMLYVGENPDIFSNSLPHASDLKDCRRAKAYVRGDPQLKVKCVNRPRFVNVVEQEGWDTQLPWLTLDWNKIYPDKVLDFLFLGSLRTAQTPLVYEDLNIGFVLTAGRGLEVQLTEGMRHLELVVDDIPGAASDIEPLFEEAFSFIEEARKARKGILIHCFAGLSRSVTITVAYLMKTLFPMTRDDALALVRQSRPAAEPNRGFMETLLKFEKLLIKSHEARRQARREALGRKAPATTTPTASSPEERPVASH